MYMIQKFVADAKKAKNDIDFINNILTGLIHPETMVSVVNQTPVCIEYDISSPEYTGRIVFDGNIVKFLIPDANVEMEKFGYMKLKLNVLCRELDTKIKTNAKMAARAKKHDALVMALKSRLSEHLLGRGGL